MAITIDAYIWSGATGAGDGTSWADAYTTRNAAYAAGAPGDHFGIASDHAENYTANTTVTAVGTLASPCHTTSLKRADDTYETMEIGGGGFTMNLNLDMSYTAWMIYQGTKEVITDDIVFSTTGDYIFSDSDITCSGLLRTTQAGHDVHVVFDDVRYTQETAGNFGVNKLSLEWRGGSYLMGASGSLAGSSFIICSAEGTNVYIDDVDLSGVGATAGEYLVDGIDGRSSVKINRCKLNSGLAGFVETTVLSSGVEVDITSCSSADIIYQFHVHRNTGTIEEDTAIYLAATYDGTNGYAAKMASNSNAIEFTRPLRYKLQNIQAAANPTIKVELALDSATNLNDDDFWIEVEYPDGTIGAFGLRDTSSKMTAITDTPTALTTSTETWTGTSGFTTEQKRKITVTLTGGQAGIHTVWACLAKPSTTVYVDPKLVVT